jgi:hypothetical protein
MHHVTFSWKLALFHPINKAKSNEYHPISVLRQIGKVSERIVSWPVDREVQVTDNEVGCRARLSPIDAARLGHLPRVFIRNLPDCQNIPRNLLAWLHSWLSFRAMAVPFIP